MNTRYICIGILAGVLYASTAHAQPVGGPPVGEPASTSTNAFERREAAQERARARTDTVPSQVKQRAYSLTDNIRTRMNAAVARLENIATRMDTRADLLAQQGLEVTGAKGDIATARDALSHAKKILSEDLGALLYGENPRAGFFAAKTRLTTAKEQIFAARTALQSALAQLKNAVQSRDGNTSAAVSQESAETNE